MYTKENIMLIVRSQSRWNSVFNSALWH